MDDATAAALLNRVAALEAQVAWLTSVVQTVPQGSRTQGYWAQGGPGGAGPQGGGRAGIPSEILAMVAAGNKIGAIKLYRELTGCGLREAKNAIDALG
jgi:ribosomal protein L7/L12